MTEKWIETVDPTIKRWKLRSYFTESEFVISATESGGIADMVRILAEQIDAHKQSLDRAYANVKWIRLEYFLIGYFVSKLMDYVLTS